MEVIINRFYLKLYRLEKLSPREKAYLELIREPRTFIGSAGRKEPGKEPVIKQLTK